MDIPHYRILKTLGWGGMATVYLAIQESVQREVALKVMAASLRGEDEFGARFLREARIAASLQHPNVVQIHDVGIASEHHYIAMEYLPGGPVLDRSGQPRPVEFVLRVARQIAAALDYASERGVVHRDIKPDNILLREDGTAVLTDFGIARASDASRMTRTGAIVGTPHYMSPEQARGLPLDGRSDLYGLGVVLYELLVGHVPYKADDSLAIGIMHITAPLPRLPENLSKLQPLLDRLLAKDPQQRFQRGNEVIEAIDALQAGRSIAAAPASAPAAENPRTPPPAVASPTPLPPMRAPSTGTPLPNSRLSEADLPLIAEDAPQLGRLDEIMAALEEAQPVSSAVQASPLSARDTRVRDDRRDDRRETRRESTREKRRKKQEAAQENRRETRSGSRRIRASRRGLPWGGIMLVGIAAAVGGAYWFQDELRSYLPQTRMNTQLHSAELALAQGRLDGKNGAHELYLSILAQDPDNQAARQGLSEVGRRLLEKAQQSLALGDEVPARNLLTQAATLGLPAADMDALRTALSAREREREGADSAALADTLAQARAAASAGRLDQGAAGAVELYRRALGLDPNNAIARAGLRDVLTRMLQQAQADIERGEVERGARQIARVGAIDPGHLGLPDANAALAKARNASQPDSEAALAEADALLAAGQWVAPQQPNAADAYRAILARDPGNSRATTGLRRVAQALLSQAEAHIDEHQFEQAQTAIDAARKLAPGLPTLAASERRLVEVRYRMARLARTPNAVEVPEPPNAVEPQPESALPTTVRSNVDIATTLRRAHEAADAGRFLMPPGESAYDLYRAVLGQAPGNAEARAGLASLPDRALRRFDDAMAGNRLGAARDALEVLAEMAPNDGRLMPSRQRLARSYLAYANERLGAGELDLAGRAIDQARELDPSNTELPALQARLEQARGG